MSKVDDLRNKYPTIKIPIFDKFLVADQTDTKKYLEYYLKMWVHKDNPENNMKGVTTKVLIERVYKFDELLPYIPYKDIHNGIYMDFGFLTETVLTAAREREERTFDKKSHIYVILENDRFLLVSPKTHKGSLKYGANTRWCTASKNNEATFNSYIKSGCLAYLISKENIKNPNYKKIAFRTEGNQYLGAKLEIYTANDAQVTETSLMQEGWSVDDIQLAMVSYRIFCYHLEKIKRAKLDIEKVVDMFKSFNPEELKENFKILEQDINEDYITQIKESIENFTNIIKTFGI